MLSINRWLDRQDGLGVDLSNWDWFATEVARIDRALAPETLAAFQRFHEAIVETNRTHNLTRIVSERDAIIKHYLDALYFLKLVPAEYDARPVRMLDVGTGAGIPGIPLLLARPLWHGVLLDAVGKKVAFVNDMLKHLAIANSIGIKERSEVLAHAPAHREAYDLVVARAVAAVPELAELCLPFVKPGGCLIISKGQKGADELSMAHKALETLGGHIDACAEFELPDGQGLRHLTRIVKRRATPRQFPRGVGIPHRKPIC